MSDKLFEAELIQYRVSRYVCHIAEGRIFCGLIYFFFVLEKLRQEGQGAEKLAFSCLAYDYLFVLLFYAHRITLNASYGSARGIVDGQTNLLTYFGYRINE